MSPSYDLDKDLLVRLQSSCCCHPHYMCLNLDFGLGSLFAYFIVVSAQVTFWFILTLLCIVHACMHFLPLKYAMEYNFVLSQSRRWKLCGVTVNRGNIYNKVQSCISIWYVLYGCTLVLDFVIQIIFQLKYKLFLMWKATVVSLACCSRTKKRLLFQFAFNSMSHLLVFRMYYCGGE